MKINITFESEMPISLPVHYNHMVQAMIYNALGEKRYQQFMHDEGYTYEKRCFKLFTFSKLLGKYELSADKKTVQFGKCVHLVVSSSQSVFIEQLIDGLQNTSVRIGKNQVQVKRIKRQEEQLVGRSLCVKSLSPIVAYSTIEEGDKKKTKYYGPHEDAFSQVLKENVIKKYKAIYGETVSFKEDFKVTAIDLSKIRRSVVYYKNFIINGYNGHFLLEGNPILIQLALEAGLGGKNAQGFGTIERLEEVSPY